MCLYSYCRYTWPNLRMRAVLDLFCLEVGLVLWQQLFNRNLKNISVKSSDNFQPRMLEYKMVGTLGFSSFRVKFFLFLEQLSMNESNDFSELHQYLGRRFEPRSVQKKRK